MKKDKKYIIDKIFIIEIIISGIVGGLIDGFMWIPSESSYGGFPVYSCISIAFSYACWILLLIYSLLTCFGKENKPNYVRWYMYFLLPFFQLPFILAGWLISYLLILLF